MMSNMMKGWEESTYGKVDYQYEIECQSLGF